MTNNREELKMSQIEIKSAKRELNRYEKLKETLELLKTDLLEETLPIPEMDDHCGKINLEGINDVLNLVQLCAEHLEAHIDDLESEA